MSGATSRRKGVGGEREVRKLFEEYGFRVRGLEGQGDHLAIGHGLTLSLEVKRKERLNIWECLAQAERETPDPFVPGVLVFRRNRSSWKIAMDADDLLGLITKEAT